MTESQSEAGLVEPKHKKARLVRVREALAARDWVGIAIELLVVALGVLLAFRIEQWGQQRNRNAEERQFLQRLHRENERSIGELRTAYATHRTSVEQLGAAIRARGNPVLLGRFTRQTDFGCWTMQMPATSYNETAAQELIASGRLSLVSDHSLLAQLRELSAAQAEGAERLGYSRQITQIFVPYLHPYHRMSLGAGLEPTCFVDWPALMRDPQAVSAAIRTYRAHVRMMQSRRSLLTLAEKAQAALACSLNRPECRMSGSAISQPS